MEADLIASDSYWKEIQQNTFTRWTNEHLKTVDCSVHNLETDFEDGLSLIALVEVLSQKTIPRYNRHPTFRSQKLENVSVALEFLQAEGIRLVNIDSSDIVDCKLKLILGLVWTLILHYSISMPSWQGEEEEPQQTGATPKQRLLNWIQYKIPDMPVKNFTKDWTTGKPVGALVDACAPGLCPDWESWDPENAVQNATEAMDLADEWLDVRQLITPEELVNPNVDEQSVMTYLAQYPNCQLREGAPLRSRMEPDGPPAYERVRAFGAGLEPYGIFIGTTVKFTVDTLSAGYGLVDVDIESPSGQMERGYVSANYDGTLCYTISYMPKVEGLHRVHVKYAGYDIPDSPFSINVEYPPVEYPPVEYPPVEYPPVPPVQTYPEQNTTVEDTIVTLPEYAPAVPEYPPAIPEYYPPPIPEYSNLALVDNSGQIGQLTEGMCFTFTGRIGKRCNRFDINLAYKNAAEDVALHINPRFPQKHLVRNTKVGGVWGREEISTLPSSLSRGRLFEIQVLVTDDCYLISINNHHFGAYMHRRPYGAVSLLSVHGDVSELQIIQSFVENYPKRFPEMQPAFDGLVSMPLLNNVAQIDYLFEGYSYIFSGRIGVDCHDFSINLKYDERNTALHIVSRFQQKTIVRNTKKNSVWGREEGSSALPFLLSRSGNFVVQVFVTDSCYLIAINGHHWAQYAHRLPYGKVRFLSVKGDVEDVQIYHALVQGYPHRLVMTR